MLIEYQIKKKTMSGPRKRRMGRLGDEDKIQTALFFAKNVCDRKEIKRTL